MGTFHVYIGIGHPDGGDAERVLALVDTGSTHSIMPAFRLADLQVQPYAQQRVAVADNRYMMWDVGKGRMVYQGQEWVCPVVFGPEEQYLLGATTLEAFNLVVDPNHKELIPAERVARPF